jgi:hypothetical protein
MIRTTTVLAALFLTAAPLLAQSRMSFFITSRGPGNGAALGGLEGADAHCSTLAREAGAAITVWRAYLSAVAEGGKPAVNARDRIGRGPWHNFAGVEVARDVAHLHSDTNLLNKENSLTEKGAVVNGRGDSPNMHDILTGAALDGSAISDTLDTTCRNWTSSDSTGSARVGHHDRIGGGQYATSWNSAHGSRGCGQRNLQGTGGNGLFYCFGVQ